MRSYRHRPVTKKAPICTGCGTRRQAASVKAGKPCTRCCYVEGGVNIEKRGNAGRYFVREEA